MGEGNWYIASCISYPLQGKRNKATQLISNLRDSLNEILFFLLSWRPWQEFARWSKIPSVLFPWHLKPQPPLNGTWWNWNTIWRSISECETTLIKIKRLSALAFAVSSDTKYLVWNKLVFLVDCFKKVDQLLPSFIPPGNHTEVNEHCKQNWAHNLESLWVDGIQGQFVLSPHVLLENYLRKSEIIFDPSGGKLEKWFVQSLEPHFLKQC